MTHQVTNVLYLAANVVIVLRSDYTFPVGFDQVIKQAFVTVTGISNNRVTIVSKQRHVAQLNTLETELQIAPGTCLNEARFFSYE